MPERIEVFASPTTITWAFSTLEQHTKEKRLSFRLRQLWLLRAALQAVQLDQQHLDDVPGTADKLRRVLVCRAQMRPERIKIEPRYEDGQLVGCELAVLVPLALQATA